MIRSLRIVFGDDDCNVSEYLQEMLPRMGHQVVGAASTGRQLIEQCLTRHPDLVITDIKMPEVDGITAAEEIYGHRPVPILLLSSHCDSNCLARAEKCDILAYLIKPIGREDLEAAICVAMQRFDRFQALSRETAYLRQTLEQRKIIERAKGLLMKQNALTEEDAYRRLQKLAMDSNHKLIDVAHMVLAVGDAFR